PGILRTGPGGRIILELDLFRSAGNGSLDPETHVILMSDNRSEAGTGQLHKVMGAAGGDDGLHRIGPAMCVRTRADRKITVPSGIARRVEDGPVRKKTSSRSFKIAVRK